MRFGTNCPKAAQLLMPLDKYPFSERYGWIQDKYGLTWQLMLTNPEGEERPQSFRHFCLSAKNAANRKRRFIFIYLYLRTLKQGHLARYPKGMEPDKEGTIMFSDFSLENQWFSQWIAHMSIHSILTRPSHLWCIVTHKKKLITTGKALCSS